MSRLSPAERRKRDLAKIHIAWKQLGMDEDTYRQMLNEVAGVTSSAQLTPMQRSQVLHRLQQLGFKPKTRKPRQKVTARDPQDRKIRAIWLDLANQGVVRNRSEKALAAYVKRQTGVDRLDWLSSEQASRVIEALKQWQTRVEQQIWEHQ